MRASSTNSCRPRADDQDPAGARREPMLDFENPGARARRHLVAVGRLRRHGRERRRGQDDHRRPCTREA